MGDKKRAASTAFEAPPYAKRPKVAPAMNNANTRPQKTPVGKDQENTPDLLFGDLPMDIVDEVFSRLHHFDVAQLRLTCQALSQDSLRHIFSRLNFSNHPFSVTTLEHISSIPEYARWVKTVTMEDIRPITEEELSALYPELTNGQKYHWGLHRDWILNYRDDLIDAKGQRLSRRLTHPHLQIGDSCTETLRRAIARFPNLETIEFHSGYLEKQPPGPDADKSMKELLRVDPDSDHRQADYRERLWQDRGSDRLYKTPPSKCNLWNDRSVKQFHDLVCAALQKRKRPLAVKIDTVHYWALQDNGTNPFPANNALSSLEIRYRGDNSWPHNVDIDTLTDTESGTAAQFTNLKELKLSGNSILDQGLLRLQPFHHDSNQYPTLSKLEAIALNNVAVDRHAVKWLKNQPVHLDMKDTVFIDSIDELSGPSNLRSVRLTGICVSAAQATVPALSNARSSGGADTGGTKNRLNENNGGGLVTRNRNSLASVHTRRSFNSDEVWIVGDKETSLWTAERFWSKLSAGRFPSRMRSVRHVRQDDVENCVLNGSRLPFERRNLLMRTTLVRSYPL